MDQNIRLRLYAGDRTISSWSLRPWLLLKLAKINFELEEIPLYQTGEKAPVIKEFSPSGLVPILYVERSDKVLRIHDSLSICEYLAELFPEKNLWPSDSGERAYARSICAEMHSGFRLMREKLNFTLEQKIFDQNHYNDCKKDIDRVQNILEELLILNSSRGPYLFGKLSIADAFYIPVVLGRFMAYSIPVSLPIKKYMEYLLTLPEIKEFWSR